MFANRFLLVVIRLKLTEPSPEFSFSGFTGIAAGMRITF